MAWKLANNCRLTLIQNAADDDTEIYVSAADGDLLPALGVLDKAPAVITDGTYKEIVYITDEADGTLTVERAKESTSARDWPSGSALIHTPTAEVLQAVLGASNALIFDGPATRSSNEYTLSLGAGATIPSLIDGEEVAFLIPSDNPSDDPTLVVTDDGTNSTTSKSIRHQNNTGLGEGDLKADWLALCRFNETNDCWVLVAEASNNIHATKLNDGPVPLANLAENGDFEDWETTSHSTPASGTEVVPGYTVEYDGTIGAFTFSQQAFTLGQTEVPGNPRFFCRWAQSAAGSGSTYRRLRKRLGRVWEHQGADRVRAIWLKADAARTVTGNLIQHFGTGGSPSADVTAETLALAVTTSWTRFPIPSSMDSIAGKTLGTNGDDCLILDLELPLNVTMTIEFAQDFFGAGLVAPMEGAQLPWKTQQGGTGQQHATFQSLVDAIMAAASLDATSVPITDTGGYFTGTEVETALQEAGSDIQTLQGDVSTLQSDVAALGVPIQLKGTWDASSGSFPGGGAAQAGWSYIVSVDGTVDSVSFTAGDRIVAIIDNASTSTYASNWFKADYTDLVSSVVGQVGAVTASQILTALLAVDGAGSGLDADLLDGQSSAYYATAAVAGTAAAILASVKTVDGASSGLDADLLDGQHGSYYQPANSRLTAFAANSALTGTITVSTSDPSGGSNGDIWFKRES